MVSFLTHFCRFLHFSHMNLFSLSRTSPRRFRAAHQKLAANHRGLTTGGLRRRGDGVRPPAKHSSKVHRPVPGTPPEPVRLERVGHLRLLGDGQRNVEERVEAQRDVVAHLALNAAAQLPAKDLGHDPSFRLMWPARIPPTAPPLRHRSGRAFFFGASSGHVRARR